MANQSAAWSRKDWAGLGHLVKAVGSQQDKRERIRQALTEHPEASHNAIAKALAVSPHTVGEVCKLQTSPCCHGATGPGARTDRKPPTPAQQRVEEELRQNPHRTDGQIAAAAGLAPGSRYSTHTPRPENPNRLFKFLREDIQRTIPE